MRRTIYCFLPSEPVPKMFIGSVSEQTCTMNDILLSAALCGFAFWAGFVRICSSLGRRASADEAPLTLSVLALL